MSGKSKLAESIYQIKISLKGSRPLIWRRVLVSGADSLARLHMILQAVMGWENYHLHMYRIQGGVYGDPEDDELGNLGTKDEHDYSLAQLISEAGTIFEYEYDFGDSWGHLLEVEAILPQEDGGQIPRCTAGERSGPPEDVGGIWGFDEYLHALQNRKHPRHEEYLAWRGPFDPEKLSLQAINARLFWLSNEPRARKLGLNAIERLDLVHAYFPSLTRWAQGLDERDYATAEALPVRRDMGVLLTYLRDHKVTGTRSTGNLPLKPAKEISAQFVNPPAWEEGIGQVVFPVRSSRDVWQIYFLKVLAQVGELLTGGKGLRIRFTAQGEEFLATSAPLQVWYMLAVWLTRVNWLIAYPFDGMGDRLPYDFTDTVAKLLLRQPVAEPIQYEPFANRLIQEANLVWHSSSPGKRWIYLRDSIERMVIDPLADFGVISPKHQSVEHSYGDRKKLLSFQVTQFGKSLLESLVYFGRWVDA
jgi:hypothetical protein